MNPGDTLDGRYEIISRLGAGGMGEVYKATHLLLGATRVIKVIHSNISSSADARERFLREARAATKVQHQNVATVHDFAALPDGSHYMVWEFIDGENLAQRLRTRGPLPPKSALRIGIQALHGLEAIHRAGIIHRDISPENLMISHADDSVKIIDLGVAKLEDPSDAGSTRTGIFVGKLRYASPEQLGFLPEGEKIDARTDLHSMAMVIFELLTGRPPYEAKSPHEYFLLHAREEQGKKTLTLPIDMPGGSALRQVLERAMERDRTRRFASASEFAAALESVERSLDVSTDETWRGVPSAVAPNPTVVQPQATTVRTPMPAPMEIGPPASRRLGQERLAPVAPETGERRDAARPAAGTAAVPRKSRNPLFAVIAAVIVVTSLAIGAVMFWPQKTEPEVKSAEPVQASKIAESSVTVTTRTAEPEPLQPPVIATQTTAAATTSTSPAEPNRGEPVLEQKPKPEPIREREPERQPEPAPTSPEPRSEPAASMPAYVDGGGDEDTNERLLDQLRRELTGTRRMEIHGGAMEAELIRNLKEQFPALELVDGAAVVLHFKGVMQPVGLGRKKRAGTATITKNGRLIFRYELPEEVFRVGAHPPEAFVSVLSDALEIE